MSIKPSQHVCSTLGVATAFDYFTIFMTKDSEFDSMRNDTESKLSHYGQGTYFRLHCRFFRQDLSALCTPLHVACYQGCMQAVEEALKSGQDINSVYIDDATPLHIAIHECRFDVAMLLVEAGADVNLAMKSGMRPLHVALIVNIVHLAETLIEAGFDLGGKNSHDSAIWPAAEKIRGQMIRKLIDADADVNAADKKGLTPLHYAVHHQSTEIVQVLIDAGADVNARDTEGYTPMHYASESYKVVIVEALIKAGADINAVDNKGRTPLHWAANAKNLRIIRFLVDAGADVQLLSEHGKSAFDHLIYQRVYDPNDEFFDIYRRFINAGAIVDGVTATISPLVPSDVIRAIVPEDTPYWLAANNDAPMLAAELAGGLDTNMKTENGMTLLHWACAGDAPECMQLLLDAGADKEAGDLKPVFYCMHESSVCLENMIHYDIDVNESSVFGYRIRYPIDYALAANSPVCVTALVGAGAWVTMKEMKNQCYNTPLESALKMRPVPVDALRALLAAAGERVLSEKIDGRPAMYWAVENSTVDGVRVLVEAGADVNEEYEEEKSYHLNQYKNILEFAQYSSKTAQSNMVRFNRIVDYLKMLPNFAEDQ